VTAEFDRRRLLGAGGVLSLAGVLAACGAGSTPAAAPTTTAAAVPTSPAAPTTTTPPPPPAPVATDLLAGSGTCVLTHETIAGPTWFDAHAVRTDIREDRPGVSLDVAFRVVQLPACTPVAQAVVDLWQCDALGIYSGFTGAEPGQGGHPGGRDEYGDAESAATDPATYLRGTQVTGADGVVRFSTVYPGWYPTRTAHLHLKVHLDGATVLTTQLFFDDAVSDEVYAGSDPYRQHADRDTRNDRDAFYDATALLTTARSASGWLAATTLGVPA
jgi:protocatechuate 3,4-dioxygenase beta subunit